MEAYARAHQVSPASLYRWAEGRAVSLKGNRRRPSRQQERVLAPRGTPTAVEERALGPRSPAFPEVRSFCQAQEQGYHALQENPGVLKGMLGGLWRALTNRP